MQFVAYMKQVPASPFKLRPLADAIRGKNAEYVIKWFASFPSKRVRPLKKLVESAVANAKNLAGIERQDLFIKEIFVDHGQSLRRFKCGAQGRSNAKVRNYCHAKVALEQVQKTEKK